MCCTRYELPVSQCLLVVCSCAVFFLLELQWSLDVYTMAVSELLLLSCVLLMPCIRAILLNNFYPFGERYGDKYFKGCNDFWRTEVGNKTVVVSPLHVLSAMYVTLGRAVWLCGWHVAIKLFCSHRPIG